MLPTIYKKLKDKQMLQFLPEDLVIYLQEIYQINFNRNLLLLKQVKEINQIFTKAHIKHAFLKGSALLIKGSEARSLERMVGDIDILVAKNQLQQAFDLLQQHGYTKNIGFDYEVQHFRHLDRQISKDGLGAVELHDELIRHPKQHLVHAKAMLEQRVFCNGLPIPNDYFMGLHSVMALQINDFGYYYKRVSLKTLYDSLVLQVPQQPALLETLQCHRYGRFFLAWSQVFCKDYNAVKGNFIERLELQHFYLKITFPIYGSLVSKMKAGFDYLKQRISLWFNNPSYRRHILKHKFKNPA